MRLSISSVFFLVSMLVVSTSCVKYYDLVKSEFPQGRKMADYREIALRYRRSAVVYDEFQTQASFTALWCSDEWRKAYIDLYGAKRGLNAEMQEEMLKRQLEENRHWITFYLLADVRDKVSTSLSDSNAAWSLYAEVDGKKLQPAPKKEGIKDIELEPEIQSFFGKTFNLFKDVYVIKIPITPDIAEKIAQRHIRSIKLVISSSYKDCVMEWTVKQIEEKIKVVDDEDFYWG